MEPATNDATPTARTGKTQPKSGTFIVLLMAVMCLAITIFWARGAYTWWCQYQIVSDNLPVVGRIEDIRFVRESNNNKSSVFQLTYSYMNDVAPLRNSVDVAVPGGEGSQQKDRFRVKGRQFQVGDEIRILVSTKDAALSIPADFVRSFDSHLKLGLVLPVLWILFGIRVRGLLKR